MQFDQRRAYAPLQQDRGRDGYLEREDERGYFGRPRRDRQEPGHGQYGDAAPPSYYREAAEQQAPDFRDDAHSQDRRRDDGHRRHDDNERIRHHHQDVRGPAEEEKRAVRSVLKKVEKLKQCTKELQTEIDDLDAQKRKAKQAAREAADVVKAEFLRTAAVTQRQIDEDADELASLRATIARTQPEVEELRNALREQKESNSARRAKFEREREERDREMREEIQQITEMITR